MCSAVSVHSLLGFLKAYLYTGVCARLPTFHPRADISSAHVPPPPNPKIYFAFIITWMLTHMEMELLAAA